MTLCRTQIPAYILPPTCLQRFGCHKCISESCLCQYRFESNHVFQKRWALCCFDTLLGLHHHWTCRWVLKQQSHKLSGQIALTVADRVVSGTAVIERCRINQASTGLWAGWTEPESTTIIIIQQVAALCWCWLTDNSSLEELLSANWLCTQEFAEGTLVKQSTWP